MLDDPLPWWWLLAYGLGLGLVWTAAHCAGMCGPLVMALGLHAPELSGASAGKRLGGVGVRLGGYQIGRLLVYAVIGLLAGSLGAVATTWAQFGAEIIGVALGVAFLVAALLQLRRRTVVVTPDARPPLATRLALWSTKQAPNAPFLRGLVLGMGMAALPCGIVFWAIGLAVATAHPWSGALLMASLVVLTTPALAGVALSPLALLATPERVRAGLRGWAGRWLSPVAMALSGMVILGTTIARHYGAACPHCG
jgi:sulfite exporter TauE/SafE